MKKPDLGQSIAILANVGVIAGIVFLGFELRQNTGAIQASMLQGLTDLSADYLITTSLDSEFVRLQRKLQERPDDLDDIELRQMQRVQRSQWMRYQASHRHWVRGSLGSDDWQVYRLYVCNGTGVFGVDLQARFWIDERRRGFFTDEFAAYMEDCNSAFPSTLE